LLLAYELRGGQYVFVHVRRLEKTPDSTRSCICGAEAEISDKAGVAIVDLSRTHATPRPTELART
jgi:hypothetical protein